MARYFLLLCFLLGQTTFALQNKAAKENATIIAPISSEVLNRIYVETDRIKEVYGMDGTYKLQKDEESGSVFIMPAGASQTQAIYVFLKTEQGRHYALQLMPEKRGGETIAIKPLSAVSKLANKWELSNSYDRTIVELIKKMACAEIPDGYTNIPMGTDQAQKAQNPLLLKLLNIYRGQQFEGQVWIVTNNSAKTLQLNAAGFLSTKVKAAALEQTTLAPHAQTRLFWVVSNA